MKFPKIRFLFALFAQVRCICSFFSAKIEFSSPETQVSVRETGFLQGSATLRLFLLRNFPRRCKCYVMTCFRRIPLYNHLNTLHKSSCSLKLRWKSSGRRIQVVSDTPRVRTPTEQQHKWKFLNSSQPQITTTNSAPTTTEYEDDGTSSGHRYTNDVNHERTKSIRRAIDFTTVEKRTLTFLRNTEDYINEQRSIRNKVCSYIVGGWVRDKLMGKQPPDMDICLQNISPAEFVQTLIDLHGFESHSPRLVPLQPGGPLPTLKTSQKLVVGAHKFEYDPGNGKVLQVAGIILFDTLMRMEFAEMKADTSEDGDGKVSLMGDAVSRELTVNAIYFRLQNMALIDPTGLGLVDLRRKVFRTPGTPMKTFMDDPIRIIRLMRFAGRFHDNGFTVEKETFATLTDPDVRVSLPKAYQLTLVGDNNTIPPRENK